jgi:HupE/UreJ protein
MEMDLHASQLLPALFGFNSGVEIGQLAIVAAAWPLLAWLARRRLHWRRLVAELGSAAIVALGVFWVVVRGWPA